MDGGYNKDLPHTHHIMARDLELGDYTIWSEPEWERVVTLDSERNEEIHFVLQGGDGCVVKADSLMKIRRPCRLIRVFPDGEVI